MSAPLAACSQPDPPDLQAAGRQRPAAAVDAEQHARPAGLLGAPSTAAASVGGGWSPAGRRPGRSRRRARRPFSPASELPVDAASTTAPCTSAGRLSCWRVAVVERRRAPCRAPTGAGAVRRRRAAAGAWSPGLLSFGRQLAPRTGRMPERTSTVRCLPSRITSRCSTSPGLRLGDFAGQLGGGLHAMAVDRHAPRRPACRPALLRRGRRAPGRRRWRPCWPARPEALGDLGGDSSGWSRRCSRG